MMQKRSAPNIAVNLAFFQPGATGGGEVYVRSILRELVALNPGRLTAFVGSRLGDNHGLECDVQVLPGRGLSQTQRLLQENLAILPHLKAGHYDVLFSPGNIAPVMLPHPIPQVATIHDLQHEHYPEYFSAHLRLARKILFRMTAKRCSRIIADSDFTRSDVIERFRVRPEKVTTVHLGVDAPTSSAHYASSLPKRFLYYPAALLPHKNHEVLFEALRLLADAEIELVLTGVESGRRIEVEAMARRLGVSHRVHHLGLIKRGEVFDLMRRSAALVFPSRFEGFGLPPVEAQYLGTPVIAASSASIPEIVGDGALLVSPDDAKGWAAAIARVIDDGDYRRNLIAKGRTNAARFQWRICAEQTLEVLQGAIAA